MNQSPEASTTIIEPLTYSGVLAKFPEVEDDLIAVGQWTATAPEALKYTFEEVPMALFAEDALAMYSSYDEFPRDAVRTRKIMRILKKGGRQLPLFYDTSHGFVMEGRHRMVAFYLMGFTTTPVIKVHK